MDNFFALASLLSKSMYYLFQLPANILHRAKTADIAATTSKWLEPIIFTAEMQQ